MIYFQYTIDFVVGANEVNFIGVANDNINEYVFALVDNVIRLNARKEGTNDIVQINIEIENLGTGLIKNITIPNKKIVLKEETNECN